MTAQEIVKIFHAYNGAQYSVDTDTIIRNVNWRFFHLFDFLENPKLLLTDLSMISDEHGNEIAKMYGGVRIHLEDNFLQVIDARNMVPHWFLVTQSLPHNLADQLRAWNYNIGYGKYTSQDLITEGVVILNDKNKGI